MTEREKLIDLLQNVPADYEGNRGVGTIADYLLNNGVIILPCSIGDTVKEREYQGRTYLNPLKTIYIWAYQDRKAHQGYWSTWTGATRKKHKNHGGS